MVKDMSDESHPVGDDIDAILRAAARTWELDRPHALYGAFKRSADGKHIRYLVCPTVEELVNAILRAEAEEQ